MFFGNNELLSAAAAVVDLLLVACLVAKMIIINIACIPKIVSYTKIVHPTQLH